jgi:hypothetical protein
MKLRFLTSTLLSIPFLLLAGLAGAQDGDNDQIEDNLSSYTGRNAEGYLGPLRDALGASLNSGIFMYAGVPREGFHIRLDLRGMLVSFDDDDRTFDASTEDYFGSDQEAEVPTVVGDEDAVTVEDPETGASFTFPGGFNIDRFGLAVPQLTIGSIAGTEAVIRYITAETGDAEIGEVTLRGIGFRHSLSSYLEGLPLDLAVTGFWQNLEIGDDFIDATATTFGVQGGKSFGMLAAYAGLSYDSMDMEVAYDTDIGGEDERLEVDFDKESTGHLTLGATARLGILHLNGEFNQASNTSLAFALGLGN